MFSYAPIVETKFLELAMSLLDFSPRIPLGTFSNLLPSNEHFSVSLSSNVYPLEQTPKRLIPFKSHKLSFYHSFSVQTISHAVFGQTFLPINYITCNSVLQYLRDVLL